MRITVELSTESLHALNRPLSPDGGWQNFAIRIRENNLSGNQLTLNTDEVEKLIRYAFCYGDGTWQRVLRPAANEVIECISRMAMVSSTCTLARVR